MPTAAHRGDRPVHSSYINNVQRLKELRTLRALTLRELGQQSGVSYATIWRLENGHKEARPSTIRKLAHALGVDTAELVIAKRGDDA